MIHYLLPEIHTRLFVSNLTSNYVVHEDDKQGGVHAILLSFTYTYKQLTKSKVQPHGYKINPKHLV